MEWINGLFTVHSAFQAVVVLSLICFMGLVLGKIHIKGISLGVAFVFFIGIIAGHLGLEVDPQMLNYAETFGLVLFVYTLGLHVGPNFFGSLRREGISLNLWGMAVILLGTVMALVLCQVTNIPLQTMVGLFCGATTNTPALGAAQQALENFGLSTRSAALGCAVTYPLGVVGVIFAMIFLRKLFVKPLHLHMRSKKTTPMWFNSRLSIKPLAEKPLPRFRKWRIYALSYRVYGGASRLLCHCLLPNCKWATMFLWLQRITKWRGWSCSLASESIKTGTKTK